jgi:ubiquinone/menaquinone biosynthesis C-methylase UbiE
VSTFSDSNQQVNVINWIKNDKNLDEVYIHSRSFFEDWSTSLELSDSEMERKIYLEHIYIEKYELEEILNATIKVFDFNPHGVGMELGAGCGAVSIFFAKKFSKVNKIYSVEIVPEIVNFAQTALISIAKVKDKVLPVIGSFDELQLPDNSVDWIIEFDSLHHSFNLAATALEASRVLKPGGKLIAIDRSHWSTSKSRRKNLENQAYSKEWLSSRGLDTNLHLTRSENGEHEHLLKDYRETFLTSGFTKFRWFNLISPEFSLLKYSLISAVPWKVRKNSRFSYIQVWPIRKLLWPVLLMNFFNIKKVGKFIRLDRKKDSARFQSKTIMEFTK